MKILDLISIFVVLANISLGFFVWWKGKKKKANIWFFIFTLAISVGQVANYFSLQDIGSSEILFWIRLVMAFAVIQVMSFFLFIYSFIHKEYNFRTFWLITYVIIGILTTIMAFSSFLFSGVEIDGSHRMPIIGSGVVIFALITVGTIIFGFILLLRRYSKEVGIVKMQLKYIMLGAIIMFALLLTFNFGLVVLFKNSNFVNYASIFILPFTLSASYAILKYRLLDIRLVIRKGAVNSISIAIVLFLYLYLLFFTQKYLVETYHWNSQTSIIVLVLIIALTVEPLRRLLFKVVDRVFYSKQKNAREEAKKLNLVMSSSLQFDQLVKKVKSELQSYLDAQSAQFLWHNKQSGRLENYYKDDSTISFSPIDPLFNYLQTHPDILVVEEIPYMMEEAINGEKEILEKIDETLKKLNIGLVCPIGEKGELVGAFFFSQKVKKEAFTSDNVEYLSGLQFQLTGAIANALLYKQAVERIARLK